VWLRRARDWSNAGVLPASGQGHEGSGRHRQYRPDTVYLAAVLLRMADVGVPIGDLTRISALIRAPHRTAPERQFKLFWDQAKSLANPLDAYLAIAPDHASGTTYYVTGFGPIQITNDQSWAILNLTQAFRKLRP
jgi:hypothetical protein